MENLNPYSEHHEALNENNQALRLPVVPMKPDMIKDVLDEQLVSTRKEGYQKFLVKWKGKPISESNLIIVFFFFYKYNLIIVSDFQCITEELLERYQAFQ